MVTRRILALTTTLAVVSFGCNARTKNSSSSQISPVKSEVCILVAKRTIPSWKLLQLDDVEWQECNPDKIPVDAIHLGEPALPWGDLNLRTDQLRFPVYKGQHIRRNDVRASDLSAPNVIPQGHQVHALRANTADPYLRTLTYEDLVEIEIEISAPERLAPLSTRNCYRRTILRDVRIFRIERRPDHTTLHLILRPDQVEKLLLARQLGNVSVVSPIRPGS